MTTQKINQISDIQNIEAITLEYGDGIISSSTLTSQSTYIDNKISEQISDLQFIDYEDNIENILQKFASFVADITPRLNGLDYYEEYSNEGIALSEYIKLDCMNCFHHSILYKLVCGQFIPNIEKNLKIFVVEGFVKQNSQEEPHSWNMIYDSKTKITYLVDTALLNSDNTPIFLKIEKNSKISNSLSFEFGRQVLQSVQSDGVERQYHFNCTADIIKSVENPTETRTLPEKNNYD